MTTDARIRVKVCGITRAEDARALDALGVDFLGFNFWPGSKRFIAPEAAAPIIASLRHAEPVGVFVDHAPAEITAIAKATGTLAAQLHGSEGWDTIGSLDIPVIKAIPHTRLADWGGLRPEWALRSGKPRQFLVDTQAVSGFGGSGEAFDWAALRDADLPRPYFLAGGIGPDNIAEAIRIARPFAVDLNSKVETAPGVKDVEAVERCLEILSGA
jgi:phosphoribosylanthranilate isomerase